MKIVRLKADDLRRWRKNTAFLVDDLGHLIGEVDEPLERAIATVTRSARSQGKTLEQAVAIGAGPTQRRHAIKIVVTRTGINAADFAVEPNVDGHRVINGRDVMAAEMLAEHGECQLRSPNGVILKIIRDPATHRPTFKESQQVAPRPEHCGCKAWGRPHPGTHYPTCPWNRLAPPDERAPDTQLSDEEVRVLPAEALAGLQRRAAPVPFAPRPVAETMVARLAPGSAVSDPEPLDSPDNCRNECLKWATPKGHPIAEGQHHPTCHFAKRWAIKTAREIPKWLVDLNTGEKVRHATEAEVGEADIMAKKTGTPIIHIDAVPYTVVLETELHEHEQADATTPVVLLEASPEGPPKPAAAIPGLERPKPPDPDFPDQKRGLQAAPRSSSIAASDEPLRVLWLPFTGLAEGKHEIELCPARPFKPWALLLWGARPSVTRIDSVITGEDEQLAGKVPGHVFECEIPLSEFRALCRDEDDGLSVVIRDSRAIGQFFSFELPTISPFDPLRITLQGPLEAGVLLGRSATIDEAA